MVLAGVFITIAALGSGQTEDLSVAYEITDPAEVAARVTAFQESLRDSDIPGRIRRCDMIVDVTDGRVSSNHSYGAICVIQFDRKAREYLLCDDKLVGHFALASSFVSDRGSVAEFVKDNCTGG